MKITEQRLKKIIKEEIGTKKRHLLVIPTLSEEIYKSKIKIDEGIWDSIKFGFAKLGSLEASGKLLGFGMGKVKKDAQDKLDAALEKESSKAVKVLIDAIKSEEDTKDFPNMKDQWAFQSALASILVYYDSLKAATEKYQPGKEEQPEGAMSPEAANAIVETLHQYLVNTLDNSLSDVYKHFKENLEEEGHTLAEMLDEVDWAKEAEKTEDEEPEEQFYDKKSTTMAGLESNFLPAVLSLLGGAAYTAGQIVAATAPLMYTKDFVTDPGKITQIPGATKKYFDTVVDSRGNGMLKTFSDSASTLSGQAVKPMDFAKSVDIIAKQTGNSPEEVIRDVMGTLGREEHRNVSGELSTLMYKYAKEGGKVGDIVNATAIRPEFVEFAKEAGASDVLMSKMSAAQAATQAASSVAKDAAKDAAKGAASAAVDSSGGIPDSVMKAVKDQVTGGSTSLARKTFGAGEMASLKADFISQHGNIGDYVKKMPGKDAGDVMKQFRRDLGRFITTSMHSTKESAGMAEVSAGVALGSGAVKDAGITLLGMEPGGAVMNLAGKIATGVAKTIVKQGAVTAGSKAAALVPGLGAALVPMGIAVAGGGLAIKVLRMKGKASSRASDLQTARDYIKKFAVDQPVLDPAPTPPPEGGEDKPTGEPESGENDWGGWRGGASGGGGGGGGKGKKPPEGSEEGPTPEEEEAAEEEDIFLALGKLDDDGLKIHRSNARNPEKRSSDQDTFQKAQDQAVTGRRSDPNSDDLGRKFGRGRRGPDPETLSHAQIQKAIKGKSKKPGDAFLTVDASIYNDIAKAIRKAGGEGFKATAPNKRDPMKKIIQGMLNQLVSKDKKITAAQAKQRIATAFRKKAGLSDIGKEQMDPIVAILQDYGLVGPGGTGETTKKPAGKKPTKKKQTPKKQSGKKATPKKKASPKKKAAPAKKTAPKKAAEKEKEGELNVGADGIEFGKTKPTGKKKRGTPSVRTGKRQRGYGDAKRAANESLNEVFKRWALMANIKEKK